MVTFTLPQELRALFFTPSAKAIHEVFFAAASEALSDALANPMVARNGKTPLRSYRWLEVDYLSSLGKILDIVVECNRKSWLLILSTGNIGNFRSVRIGILAQRSTDDE